MPHTLVHRFAIGIIIAAAIMQLTGAFMSTENVLPLLQRIFQLLAGCLIWAFLIWKVWKRPQTWGFGVGLFFTFMFIGQTYLWYSVASGSGPHPTGVHHGLLNYLLTKVPLALAAVSCFLVRRQAGPV